MIKLQRYQWTIIFCICRNEVWYFVFFKWDEDGDAIFIK